MKTANFKSKFWFDPWVQTLNAVEALFFVYLLSCEHHNTLYIYEISVLTMEREYIRADKKAIINMLDKFTVARKAFYFKDHIILANGVKWNSTSPAITKSYVNLMAEIPREVIEFAINTHTRVSELLDHLQTVYRPSTDHPSSYLNLSNSIKSHPISSNLKSEKIPDDEWDERFSLIFEDIEDDYGLSNIDTNKLRAIAGDKPGRAAISDLYLAIQANKKVKKKGAYLMKSLFTIKNGVQK